MEQRMVLLITSIRGLFDTQRRKIKEFVLRTTGGDANNEYNL